jgi:hypothetical protein
VEITVLAGVDPFPTTRRDDAPRAPTLELAALFDADPGARREVLQEATYSEVRRYMAELDRARKNIPTELTEDDTEDTRHLLIEYGFRLGEMRNEAEQIARRAIPHRREVGDKGLTHAGVA